VLFLQGVLTERAQLAPGATVLEKARNSIRIILALSRTGMAFTNQGNTKRHPALENPSNWSHRGETQWTLAKAYYHQQQYDQR